MDEHTARVFVRDAVFDLTMMTLAPHLESIIPLSDVGICAESSKNLALALGLNPTTVNQNMTFEELVQKVAQESPLEVTVVREPLFFF